MTSDEYFVQEGRMKGSGFQGSEAFPNGIFSEFGNAPDAQFVHDLLAVGLYRLDTNVQ